MSQNIPKKLRILALHGYKQSADKFREKTYPFQRKVKKYADFVFINAPYTVSNEFVDEDRLKTEENGENTSYCENDETKGNKADGNTSQTPRNNNDFRQASTEITASSHLVTEEVTHISEETECYAWYKWKPNDTNTGFIYIGLEETFEYLENIFKQKGPFDGIFGFSQGGCVVGLLCDLQQKNLTKNVKFDIAIIASGFKQEIGDFYKEKLDIPSLHIYGENDKQIPSEWSKNLIDCFNNPVIAIHPGGHYIPGNATLKKDYEIFFKEQWLKIYENNK